jgi:hypothetical protein
MKRLEMFRRASAAWSVAALAAFELRALGLLVQPGRTTCCHDSMLHLRRVALLDGLVRQGVGWLHWLPALVLGYGHPLFNFYPALFLHPSLILHRLGLCRLRLESLHGLERSMRACMI